MNEALKSIIINYEYIAIFYLFLANSSYLILLLLGFINSRKKYDRSRTHNVFLNDIEDQLKPISILAPAYNEQESIEHSLSSLLKLDYPIYEVIVINDGSKDSTLEVLKKRFDLIETKIMAPDLIRVEQIKMCYRSRKYTSLTVIDKENGGKSDALNAGILYSSYPLICCVDSDSLLDRQGLIQLSYPFFEYPDEVLATGGTIRVANNLDVSERGDIRRIEIKWHYFSLIQIVEYLRAFLVGRMGWDLIKSNVIISGAFGLFKKEAVINVGGYGLNTVGEDLELLLRIHEKYLKEKRPYKVFFLPDPVCWTEVPEDIQTLENQRVRWQQGLAEGLWSSRRMFLRPWAKTIGNIALPYLFLFELIAAPIELLGYVILVFGFFFKIFDYKVALLFFSVSILYGWVLSLFAIIIEESTFKKYEKMSDYYKLFAGVILEQLGFHQLHLYWRLKGIYRFLRGHSHWGEMKRKGFKRG